MKLKRLGKLLLFIGLGIVGLLIIGIVSLVMILPSPYEIKESLKLRAKTETIQSGVEQEHNPPAGKSDYKAENFEKLETSHPSSKNDDSQLAFESLIDSRKPLSEACRTLTNIENKQRGELSSPEFGKRFQDSLLNKSSDPLMESLKPVLKLTLTQPSMETLISKVQEAEPTERSSLMRKMDFYHLAYEAYKEMTRNKKSMEHVLDQSYLTMMLGRVIEARPDLAENPHVIEYCNEIEKILNERSLTDFQEEKRAFLDFLSEADIDPKSIGFDVNYQTHLQIVFDKTGLHFSGGWIDDIFAQLAPKSPAN